MTILSVLSGSPTVSSSLVDVFSQRPLQNLKVFRAVGKEEDSICWCNSKCKC